MLDRIREKILALTDGENVEIYLFGSYAKGNFRTSSDVDIAIGGASEKKIREIREYFEESNIPRKVDIVDMNFAGEKILGEIERTGVRWSD